MWMGYSAGSFQGVEHAAKWGQDEELQDVVTKGFLFQDLSENVPTLLHYCLAVKYLP